MYLCPEIGKRRMKLIKNPWLDKEGYNCIGCCPGNPLGFHLSFYEDGDDVVTKWCPTQFHQGWIDTLHGGVQGVLDEEQEGLKDLYSYIPFGLAGGVVSEVAEQLKHEK